jgi:hypothetical protein
LGRYLGVGKTSLAKQFTYKRFVPEYDPMYEGMCKIALFSPRHPDLCFSDSFQKECIIDEETMIVNVLDPLQSAEDYEYVLPTIFLSPFSDLRDMRFT